MASSTQRTLSVLAIDPGPTESAYVIVDGERVTEFGFMSNDDLLYDLGFVMHKAECLAIEGMQSFGKPVGKEVFTTCIWIGRFIERCTLSHTLVYRSEVKLHLCHSTRAKDPMVRQALIDRFGPGKAKAIGLKKTPGPLYGLNGHCWSALAVAVYWLDTHACELSPSSVPTGGAS